MCQVDVVACLSRYVVGNFMPGVGAGGCCCDHSLGPKITIATISCELRTGLHAVARPGRNEPVRMGWHKNIAMYERACLPDTAGFARQGGRGEPVRGV